jgi:hypothetical protein
MTTTADSRKAAESRIQELIALARQLPPGSGRDLFLDECEALARAIAAFHMEGIRFRAYNVDRLLHKGGLSLPAAALEAFTQMRAHLEAAGFHTRSHQSPV